VDRAAAAVRGERGGWREGGEFVVVCDRHS
jgi:hypothetical protein